MSHFKILEQSSSKFAILINPAAYQVKAFDGKPDPKAIFACNVNYSWLGIAIGVIRSPGTDWLYLGAKSDLRPCFCISKAGFAEIKNPRISKFSLSDYPFVTQAGPTLLWDSSQVVSDSIKKEEFRSDAVRRTAHTAIGCTDAGKVIALFAKDSTPYDLANFFQKHKCVTAMKCDGGSQTSLWFDKDGINRNSLHYGNTTSSVVGVEFIPK